MLRVRTRLALLYTGLFTVGGAVLIAITWALTSARVPSDVLRITEVPAGEQGPTAEGATGESPGREPIGVPVPTELERRVQEQVATFRRDTLDEVLVQGSISLGIVAVASFGVGWLVAGRALRPLHRITETARRLSHENLDERLHLSGPKDELRDLADTFDEMLERIASGIDVERRFVANASHELRTPFAVQRTVLEVALAAPDDRELRAAAERALENTLRGEQLVQSLLMLARSQQPPEGLTAVDVAELARAAITSHQNNDLHISATLHPAVVEGDRTLLERVVVNLIDNAVQHNLPGGWVTVSTGVVGEVGFIEIENSGRPIAATDVPDLFAPFRRGGQDRVGGDDHHSGLGLSIVRSATVAHRGTIDARARQDGGLRIRIEVPARGTAERKGSSDADR